jgi:hypothetical protein
MVPGLGPIIVGLHRTLHSHTRTHAHTHSVSSREGPRSKQVWAGGGMMAARTKDERVLACTRLHSTGGRRRRQDIQIDYVCAHDRRQGTAPWAPLQMLESIDTTPYSGCIQPRHSTTWLLGTAAAAGCDSVQMLSCTRDGVNLDGKHGRVLTGW